MTYSSRCPAYTTFTTSSPLANLLFTNDSASRQSPHQDFPFDREAYNIAKATLEVVAVALSEASSSDGDSEEILRGIFAVVLWWL